MSSEAMTPHRFCVFSTGSYSISIRMGARVLTMAVMSLSFGLRIMVANISAASLRERVTTLDVNMAAALGEFRWYIYHNISKL